MLGTAGGARDHTQRSSKGAPLAFVRDSHFMTTTQVRHVVSTPGLTFRG